MKSASTFTCLLALVVSVLPVAAQELAPLPAELPRLLPDDLFRRNIGTPDMLDRQFPPHRIIDNVYYVGTESLASFLITTEAGHILVNTDFERNVETIRNSVEQLGFDFEDIEIIIGSHEHGDHMEGDALAKQLSGADVVVVAEQVPGLRAMRPGGKEHPMDRIINDGDTISLGGETLTAHLTPGHSAGCTSWELDVEEAGRTEKVVIICSVGVNPNYQLFANPDNPDIVDEYRRSHAILRSIPATVPLGSHPSMFRMAEKYPLRARTPNPYIDPEGYRYEIALNEQAMNLRLHEQRRAVLSQVVEPESVGLSSARLRNIDTLIQSHIDAGRISGAVTLVARHGRIAHLKAQGLMDIADNKPMQSDTIFRLASMSKPVGALALLMLLEEGKVKLDDPVAKYLPSFANQQVAVRSGEDDEAYTLEPAARAVTVFDLLTHTSGVMSGSISSAADNALFSRRHSMGLTWVDELGAAPLEFQPGSRWAYSATAGFDILSRIVELASGQDFNTFLRQRVFDPLGMDDIFFWPTDAQRERLVSSYIADASGTLQLRNNPDSMSGEIFFSAAGGLMASAEAYAQFGMLLAQGGELHGVRLLGTRTMELMRSAFIPDTLPGRNPGEGFGLGVRVVTDPLQMHSLLSPGTFGWSGFYGTHLFVDPEEEIVGVLMIQAPVGSLRPEFETAVMQALID